MTRMRTSPRRGARSGQSLIDVLVASAVGAILLVGALSVLTPALRGSSDAQYAQTGAALARGMADAVRSLAGSDWSAIASLSPGAGNPYRLTTSTSPFTPVAGAETVVVGDASFVRSFHVEQVRRTSDGALTPSGGYVDPSTVKVVVTYRWPRGAARTLATYVTRARSNGFVQTSWSGGGGQAGPRTTSTPTASSYYRAVTIDRTKVPNTAQTDFPMLFSGTYAYLRTAANGGKAASASGYDIFFASNAACSAKLDHETESWSASTGAVVMWVRIPTLSSATDTVIYLCYGDASIATSQENRTGVWDASFKTVQHLGNGSALSAADATANANNGTITTPTAIAGKVHGAGAFNGSSDRITLSRTASLSQTGGWTLEAWAYPTSAPQGAGVISEEYGVSDSDVQYELGFGIDEGPGGSSRLKVGFYDGAWRLAADAANIPLNAWVHVAGTWNGTTLSLYKNGALVTATTPGGTVPTGLSPFYLGRRHDVGGSVNFFPGRVDEARISGGARSADWIAAQYNSQNAPSTFYAIGAEETASESSAVTDIFGQINDQFATSSNIDFSTVNGALRLLGL